MVEWKSFRKEVPEEGRLLVMRYCCGVDEDTEEDEYYHIIGHRIQDRYYRQFNTCPYDRNDLEDWEYLE